jgi:TetR/AcrR family transcriptional regulator, lmrAB and yxaGH operons repressor
MPAKKIDEAFLIDQLGKVFRIHGYEGASLSLIAEATGLKRASLYHRFPGGKEEMAEAVLTHVDDWFGSHILAPLSEPGKPAARIEEMAKRLSDFYGSGRYSCLLDSLSIGEDGVIRKHIDKSVKAWLGALVKVARESGLRPALAKERAEEALIGIQGALVLSRATGETKPFQRVLKNLPQLLTLDS